MGWLPGYDKRIKITIPAADVDADMTDFPVYLPITADSGITSKDLSHIISDLDVDYNTTFFDDFNAVVTDPLIWDTIVNDGNAFNGAGYLNYDHLGDPPPNYYNAVSQFRTVADIDVRTSFEAELTFNITTMTGNFGTDGPGIKLGFYGQEDAYSNFVEIRNSHVGRIYGGRTGWSNPGAFLATIQDSGKLRFRYDHVSTTWPGWADFTIWYDDATTTGWEWDGDPAGLKIQCTRNISKQSYMFIEFQNTITGDLNTQIWIFEGKVLGDGDTTNQYKIAVTDSDGTTELWTEIDHLRGDSIGLHSKVPFLSSTVDNELYFYWDTTGTVTDSTYIGETSETAAQNVWNDSFDFVAHFSQVVDGTPLLESTSNDRLIGMTGTVLRTEDGLSGIGYSQHFSGAGQYFKTDDTEVLPTTSSVTISATVTPDTVALDYQAIAVQMGTAGTTQQQWGLFIALDEVMFRFHDGSIWHTHTSAAANLVADTRYSIVAVFDSVNDTVKLYVDKVEVYSAAETGTPGGWNDNIYIGSDSGSELFDGSITELRVQTGVDDDTVIRTEEEIILDDEIQNDEVITFGDDEDPPSFVPDASDSWTPFLGSEFSLDGDICQNVPNPAAQGELWYDVGTLVNLDTSWQILNDNVQNTSWNILTSIDQDISWNILNAVAQSMAWNLINEIAQDTGWNIFPPALGFIQEFFLRELCYEFEVTDTNAPCSVDSPMGTTAEAKYVKTGFCLEYVVKSTFEVTRIINDNLFTP